MGEIGSTKEWILSLDVFKGQWSELVKKLVLDNHGKMVPVPNNMKSYFQPLDLRVIAVAKLVMLFRAGSKADN